MVKRRGDEVEKAVRRDLRKLDKDARGSGLAAAAIALAQLLDGEFTTVCRSCSEDVTVLVGASARDAAGVARELRATMDMLGRRGDSDSGAGFVAGLLTAVDDPEDRPADTRRRTRTVRGGVGDAADAVAAARRRRGAGAGS